MRQRGGILRYPVERSEPCGSKARSLWSSGPGKAPARASAMVVQPRCEVGWDEGLKRFVDLDGEPIQTLFKLYPREWIMREDFGANVKPSGALFLEPMW